MSLHIKLDIMADIIYGKAWYSHDNSLGQAVPGTANLAN